MSTATVEPKAAEKLADLRIFAHSSLLYWWPVWAVALGMALWTYLDGHHMVLVPPASTIEAARVVAPEGEKVVSPLVHMAASRAPGLIFVLTLLIVVVCSHAWIRGPWALFFAASIVGVLLFISWVHLWAPLARWFGLLHVYINLGGYLLVGVPLMIAWVVTVFFLDRRTYMVFSVGQIRFCDRLGEEERAYDTSQLIFEKRPFDWFRRLVGFGAGDMLINIGGPQPQVMELRNVVHVGKRLAVMQHRLRMKDVV
jgi:hypothetical protein